ncbi:RHS repeat-associated core domain-containing protein [Saccharibacillus sacchari]|uniref:RHS repeat-associated core domain-containing protein n=1 Tax=Saccharibacillus sacchari TaxID=456493 RepID=A0ACC6P7K5_9BACL
MIYREDASNQKAYYQHNGHGDVTGLVKADGTTLNSYTYDIWGNPLTSNVQVENPFGYSGEFWDEDTGLQYLRSRWYDPSIGRFIQEDTFEGYVNRPSSLNLYTYVENNPLKYTDPSGHECREGAVSGGGGGGVSIPTKPSTPAKYNVKSGTPQNMPSSNSPNVTFYRAVSPNEFKEIQRTGKFNLLPTGFSEKQFGYNINEVKKFTDFDTDYAAIIQVKMPRSEFNKIKNSNDSLDPYLFKSGTLSIPESELNAFNLLEKWISRVY